MRFTNYGTLIDPLLKDLRVFIARFSGLNPGDLALDVCCGTGAQVLEFGRRGILATGIDISPAMLKIAERNRLRQGMDNVSFQLGDAASLPFRDNYFDCVSVSFGLHDKTVGLCSRVVSEMERVARQYGVLILADFQVPLPGNIWAGLVRSLEFLVDGAHYQGFKDYLRSGGMDGVLKAHNLQEEERATLKSGLVTVSRVRKR
jgi:demethylmenaquinone methyltransferase/2-methoxy-6-polyprenyl-1,4-benzoquinol methylase